MSTYGVPTEIDDEKVCSFDLSVSEDFFTLKYKRNIPFINTSKILQYIRLETHYLDEKVRFDGPSGRIINSTQNSVTIQYYMPTTSKYSGILKCGKNFANQQKFRTEIHNFTIDDEYSRLSCHHEDDYPMRWCHAHNIVYDKSQFRFLSPAKFTFPSPFLIPGARAGPFDVETDRLETEPVTLLYTAQNYPEKLIVDTKPNYLYGGFYNYQQLWHATFDFIIPFYKFARQYKVPDNVSNRIVYTRSQPIWGFMELWKVISDRHFINLDKDRIAPTLFKNITIGIERNEKYPFMNRTVDDGVGFKYNFNSSSAPTFRDDVLRTNNLSTSAVGVDGKVYVLFIDRRDAGRSLTNTYELYEHMKKTCDFCKVDLIKMQTIPFIKQIELVSRASVLAGLHGSGLTNVMWMAPSRENHTTHLIEFLPKGYNCRDWYKTATEVARVEYHEAMAVDKGYHKDNVKLDWCLERLYFCPTAQCHDFLRDQTMTLSPKDFDKVWLPIVEKLKKTILVP
ncbi:hypothetical protein TVAG_344220 [Trichomonas vaginalis G3]|uniref:Glycosyltransferase 61 catalytic domain-containing protein n=1 Tax=Trichomonas vaginalis (strain ATCC PRA-98 / G3) TaxID=412133 RepID=A2E7P3_TRIV3|nr:glycosyltransferase family [Trichomonas vaginalis G3]EAY11328.1 hypothetical protein TVAG_344220 [Trichomonas vaginalis G3]KAI5523771.1 glycosyltransferase family [Trichomonas vaginalis G3]|eukprot:XP_001323551.1 hypothetical protein [Trichomonas vaginalis G3]